jgi:hypothetical protein
MFAHRDRVREAVRGVRQLDKRTKRWKCTPIDTSMMTSAEASIVLAGFQEKEKKTKKDMVAAASLGGAAAAAKASKNLGKSTKSGMATLAGAKVPRDAHRSRLVCHSDEVLTGDAGRRAGRRRRQQEGGARTEGRAPVRPARPPA